MQAGRNIAATTRSDGNLDLFTVGSDGIVYTTWWYAGHDWGAIAGDWRPIGGFFPPGAPIAAIAKSPNSIDLFVVGNDGRVYTSWWYEGSDWSGLNNNWRSIGGFFPPGAPLGVTSRHAGNLDVFVTGNDGRVYTSWWYHGSEWSGINDNWRSIGGFFPAGAPVAAITKSPNSIDLFITGNDGRVYTSWWYEGSEWSGIHDNWPSIGGFFPRGAPLSVTSRHAGNLDVFVTGNDGRVYTSWWYQGSEWSGRHDNWRPIGGFFPAGAPVSAITKTPNSIDLFITGNDGRVYTEWWYEGSEWSGINDNWRSIGGFFPAGAPVAATTKSSISIDLFITGNDRRVYTSWWYNGSEWSGIHDNWGPLAPRPRHPAITLRAILVPGEGRFVEVTGTGFSGNQTVRLAYDLFVGGGPTTHTFGEDAVTADAEGRFTRRIKAATEISGAQVKATDASGATAEAHLP
ncbi:hypothetical protein [Virgisporangium aurantiacum]|uniref:Fucose-specific lectin n=1 Tax=Virgisporangium aurantiacum TaxID=175570 RepID=A0A8J4E7J9_9ACTN|nr:hypothetical protein [Virgisporangium aurantiacum]GIJ64288.1 hypothetical protein Vau01_118040 [Virgisporangium aurantiacum]